MKRKVAWWWVKIEWKPQDCWVGLFWKNTIVGDANSFDAWLCIVPMLPIHLQINSLPPTLFNHEN